MSISTRFRVKMSNILKPQPKLLLFLWLNAKDMFFFSAETVSAFSDALCIPSTISLEPKFKKKTHKYLPCLEMGNKKSCGAHLHISSPSETNAPRSPVPRSVAVFPSLRIPPVTPYRHHPWQFDQGSSLFHGPVEHLEKVQRPNLPPTQEHDIFSGVS